MASRRRDNRETDYDDGRVDSSLPLLRSKNIRRTRMRWKARERGVAPPQLPVANPFSSPRRGRGNPLDPAQSIILVGDLSTPLSYE